MSFPSDLRYGSKPAGKATHHVVSANPSVAPIGGDNLPGANRHMDRGRKNKMTRQLFFGLLAIGLNIPRPRPPRQDTVAAHHGMVVAARRPRARQVASKCCRRWNAVDAAVATAFAMAAPIRAPRPISRAATWLSI